MELNQNLKKITQSIKAIQNYCKENELDLKTLLSKQELKQYQADLAFVKKFSPEIKGDILALKNTPVSNTIDKDISEPAFVDAVLQWRKKLSTAFKGAKKNYAAVSINTELFSKDMASNASALPLNTALYKEWTTLISKLPNPSKGADIFEALLNNNSTTWVLTGNVNTLTLHYREKANKKIYKQYDNNIGDFITDALPQISTFMTAVEAATTSEDPNLPENIANKEEVEKAKRKAYQKVLDAWKAEEVSNLKLEPEDDTLYVDMSMINAGDLGVSIHNLPTELKTKLLKSILEEAKKTRSRKRSVKDLKNIAIGALNDFHTQNLHQKENYQDLSLEEIEVIKFPSNISGWISNYQVSNKSKDPKIEMYATILESWRKSERASLDSSNASEHLNIDPATLKINSNLVSHLGIPDEIHTNFLTTIKTELTREEQKTGSLNFNRAMTLARNQVDNFARTYNVDNTIFDYKQLEIEAIRKLQFPSGLHGWIKESETTGNKKDIKDKIKVQLEMTNNFNLEALIKELKIDMGGITINNDFNFDNDVHLSYNNLKLILEKLVEINKPKKSKGKKIKTSSNDSILLMKGFKVTYCKGYSYGMDLEIPFELKKEEKGNCKLIFDSKTMETLNDSASALDYYKNNLEKVGKISIEEGEEKNIKINFSITYKYNRAIKIVRKKDSGYTISELDAGAGAAISLRFVELSIGADAKYTVVSGSDGEEVHESSPNITFTDYYTFDLNIKNKNGKIEFGIGKDVSFANTNYSRILPKHEEQVQICGPLQIK